MNALIKLLKTFKII